jgi:HlyD family secretion protein
VIVRKTLLVLPLVVAAAGYGYVRLRPPGAAPGELVLTGYIEADERIIRSEVAGRITDVLVHEGDAVEKGTLLVKIDPRDATSRRRQQELAIASLNAQIEKARETAALARASVPQAIEAAKAEIARAQAESEQAESDVRTERDLVAGKTHERHALEQAETAAKIAAAAVARAQAGLGEARAREGEIRVADATVRALEANVPIEEEKLHELDLLVEKHEVRADAPGTVQVKLVSPGELAQPGKAFVSLLDEDDKYVRVYIPVPDLSVVHVGTEMEVELDFLPGSKVPGKVEWIESQASFAPKTYVSRDDRVQQVYQARVRLAPGAARTIKSGAEAEVRLAPRK